MKKIRDATRMMGVIVDGVEWVTNGHWAYHSKHVTLPEVGIVGFARGEPWAFGSGQRTPPTEKSFRVVLKRDKGAKKARLTNILQGDPGPDSAKWMSRMVLSDDGESFAMVRESYLIDDIIHAGAEIIGPLQTVKFWSEKKLVAVVMPIRVENTVEALEEAIEATKKTTAEMSAAFKAVMRQNELAAKRRKEKAASK